MSARSAFVRYQLPAIVWALLIFIGSSIPSQDFPDSPIFDQDKLLHLIVFFGFALLAGRALRNQTRYPVLARNSGVISIVLTFLYGAFDEAHQYFVPGRSPEFADLLADTLGGLLFLLAFWLWQRRFRSVRSAD